MKEPLVYSIPEEFEGSLSVGMRVIVPLGRRRVTGVIVKLESRSSIDKVKPIAARLDDVPILDASFLKLCQWTAQYYVASLGEVLAVALPPGVRTETRVFVAFRRSPDAFHGQLDKAILDEVKHRVRVQRTTLGRLFPGRGVPAALNRLIADGSVAIEDRLRGHRREERRFRKLVHKEQGSGPSTPVPDRLLTEEQTTALGRLQQPLEKGGFQTFLLHGVTGSGKTEVYLRAMEAVCGQGRQSLILVPEIALTPQLLDRVEERFPGHVAVLHSGLTGADRWRHWWRIVGGEVHVVVGARSAVFAPIPLLGLIIVDEEHDASYKQEEGIRYHGRDLAVVRGQVSDCPVILGSATPSVESYNNVRSGRYALLEMARRVEEKPLPVVDIVDLRAREGSASATRPLFSDTLVHALQANFARGQQSLIFLNRRGFANFLQCWSCGFVLRCSHCSISLTYHRERGRVFCHHCGFNEAKMNACPECGNLSFSEVGFGTEKVEQELRGLVPRARIDRMDRDTTARRGAQERIFRSWENGELDILVGTQMITKGHDVGGVTLVGVLYADLSLNLPDFRAVEKTYQLISQVAGRAGRGDQPGRVIVQTLMPEHYCFPHAKLHDYKGFFDEETAFRRELSYPPFQRLVQLRLEGTDATDVARRATRLAGDLRRLADSHPSGSTVEILGPVAAPIAKLRDRYRWQTLLKGPRSRTLLEMARTASEWVPRSKGIRLQIDVDPYNML